MLYGILLVALWLLVLLLAMGESALTYASRAKMEDLIRSPARLARFLERLKRPGPAATACLLGRIAAAAALVAILVRHASAYAVPAWAAAGALSLIVAELAGRFTGRRWSTIVLLVLLPPLQGPALLLTPGYALWRRLFEPEPGSPPRAVVEAAKEEIRVAIEDAASEGALQTEEKEMIEGVLEFRDVEVREIMTPRTDIEWLEINTPPAEAIALMRTFHHSRIPIYEGTRDRALGIVHVRDLLRAVDGAAADEPDLRNFLRQPLFVPQTKRVAGLLREFRQKHSHMAIVLDEYGGVTGLVTIEDVLEEIVGEIEDEFDREDHAGRIKVLSEDTADVDGRVHIDEINELLGTHLPEDEDFDTVGGFVMARFASVPKPGEKAGFDGVLVQVLESDNQRVRRVLLQKLPALDQRQEL